MNSLLTLAGVLAAAGAATSLLSYARRSCTEMDASEKAMRDAAIRQAGRCTLTGRRKKYVIEAAERTIAPPSNEDTERSSSAYAAESVTARCFHN